jgi:phage terminase small subunit
MALGAGELWAMPTEQPQPQSAYEKLNDRQRAFVDAYVVSKNKTKAARLAGYSPETARSIGHENLTKPDIRAAVDERMSTLAMSAEEAMQRMSEVASTRLNEYFTIQQVQGYEQRRVKLSDLVKQKEGEIDFIKEYMNREGLVSEEEQKPYKERIDLLRLELLDYLLKEDAHGSDAEILAPGKPVVMEEATLDLVALARAEGEGLVTEFKHTKDGIQVKIADPVPALRDMLRIHGKFIDRKDITSKGERITGFRIEDVTQDDSDA